MQFSLLQACGEFSSPQKTIFYKSNGPEKWVMEPLRKVIKMEKYLRIPRCFRDLLTAVEAMTGPNNF